MTSGRTIIVTEGKVHFNAPHGTVFYVSNATKQERFVGRGFDKERTLTYTPQGDGPQRIVIESLADSILFKSTYEVEFRQKFDETPHTLSLQMD